MLVIAGILSGVIALMFDLVWFYFMGGFFKSEIGSIARLTEDGLWEVRYLPTLGVYVLLGLAIATFVIPTSDTLWRAVFLGGLLGLITYGVYDFTNLATLSAWTTRFALVDIAWGTFLCGTVSGIVYMVIKYLF